jgi:hypothetical protein
MYTEGRDSSMAPARGDNGDRRTRLQLWGNTGGGAGGTQAPPTGQEGVCSGDTGQTQKRRKETGLVKRQTLI